MSPLPPSRSPAALAFGTSRLIGVAFLGVFLFLALATAVTLQWPGSLRPNTRMADWEAFQIAGELTLEGRGAVNYDWDLLQHEQKARTGQDAFMSWAYPPPVTLLTAPLALLPVGLSYLLVQLAALVWFLRVLARAAGPHVPGALAFALPALLTNLACGQNGFLTGAIIGSFLVAMRDPARAATASPGWPLGLMVLKPHLAVGISLLALLERRWKALAAAAFVTLAGSALATLFLGPSIWAAFFAASRTASAYLFAGDYPIERMTSVFAFLASIGVPARSALALHGVVAAGALALLILAWRRGAERSALLALAGAVSLLISPYNYDYDLPVLAMLAALVWPALLARASGLEIAGLFALGWGACANGIRVIAGTLAGTVPGETALASLSAPLLVALILATAAILRRPARAN